MASQKQRIQRYQAVLKATGLRPIQIWVPDTRSANFATECRRQCLALRKPATDRTMLKRLASVTDTEGWK